MKTAVIFPGIGYHTDKPLLYFSAKLAAAAGYEIVRVPYGNFPKGVKGDREKMKAALESAMAQTEEILAGTDLAGAEELLFISKSIGTVVSGAYAARHGLSPRHIFYTPLAATFRYAAPGSGIAFHGTADPWAADEEIAQGCLEKQIPLTNVADANHSLETGDALLDIANLAKVMEETARYIRRS